MSRRFGRNQKRKMRQQIEEAERGRDYAFGRESAAREELKVVRLLSAEARDALDYLREALPRYCALLPPETISAMPEISWIRLSASQRYTWEPMPSPGEMVYATLHITQLPVVQARLKKDPFDMGAHVRVEHGDGQWGYAINDRALRLAGAKHATQYIAESIARSIVKDLGKRL